MTQSSSSIRIWWDASIDAYRMTSPFSQALIDQLHKLIPYSDRKFEKETKNWIFTENQLPNLQSIFNLLQLKPNVLTRAQVEAASQPAPKALQVPIETVIVGFVRLAGVDAMQRAYRHAAMQLHPDKGGSSDDAAKLNASWSRIKKEVFNV